MSKTKKHSFVLKDALHGLRKLKPHPKNDTKNEIKISGFNIEQSSQFKSNNYLDLINYNKEPINIFNHKARFNNARDIEIFDRLPKALTQRMTLSKILCLHEKR